MVKSGSPEEATLRSPSGLPESTDTDHPYLEAIPDGISLVESGRVVWANSAFVRLYGFRSREDVAGRSFADFQAGADETLSQKTSQTGLGQPRLWELGRREDGSTFSVERTESEVRIGDRKVAVVQHRDASAARLARRSERLASIGTLAGGIAHEFNNLLTGILLHSRVLRQKLGTPAEASSGTIDLLARRGAELVRQLVAFSRAEGGEQLAIDPVPLFKETVRGFAMKLPPNIRIAIRADADAPAVVADVQAMKGVLVSLLANAREAIPERGGSIEVRLRRRAKLDPQHLGHPDSPAGDYLSIEVSDDGEGIQVERLSQVFDPFFTTKATGSSGLGLAAVHGSVRGHGGWIDVTSRPGEGTHVEVLLPAASSIVPAPVAVVPAVTDENHGATIVFVDDESGIRSAVVAAMEAMGHRVFEGKDGQDAIDLVREHRTEIDLVILDLRMPKVNGDEAFLQIREENPDLPVFLSSGNDMEEILERLAGRKLDGVLPKPYEVEQLERLIVGVVEKKRRS